MKKMLSMWLAAVLLVSFCSIGFAANVGGVNTTTTDKIFQPVVQYNLKEGDTVNIPLGMSSLVGANGAPLAITDITNAQLNNLVRITTNANDDFAALFSYRLAVLPAENTVGSYVYLCITTKAVNQGYSFDFSIGLVNTSGNGVTPEGSWGRFSGTIQKPAQSTIIGFNRSITPSVTNPASPVLAGSSFEFPISDDMFNFSAGTGQTFTRDMVSTYGFTLSSTNSNLTPVFYFDAAGKAWVRVTVSDNTPSGSSVIADISMNGAYGDLQYSVLLHKVAIVVENPNAISTIGNKIIGIDPDTRLGYTSSGIFGRTGLNGSQIYSTDNLSIRGDDEITLEFDSNAFLWEKGKPNPTSWVTSNMIRTGKITAKIISGQSKNLVDSVEIRYVDGRAYIRVKFVERFVSTKEKDFSFTVALAYNGNVNRDTAIVIAGTMENDYISVYSGDDYVDLSYGDVAYAEESIRSIDVDLGDGVIIHARMNKGKKYYGTVDTDPTSQDYALMDKYREIEIIYNLSTVGFNNSSNTVSLDTPYTYHVYNKALEYLGTTNKKLPYSTKYILSTKQLVFSEETSEDSFEESSAVSEKPTTGSSGSSSYTTQIPSGTTPGAVLPDNENYNPVNGR